MTFTALAALAAAPSLAHATTYTVGPGQTYTELSQVEAILAPGDVVEVMGDATYPGNVHIRPESSGTVDQKVTIRGVPVNGKRPVISGGTEWGIVLHASHVVFEGFEVTGAASYCVVHKGDDVTIRDVIVHDCPNHGILGTDSESGDLTMEYVEAYANGSGDHHHQIYIATDETMYPGSRFRMQHCYVHDGNGGNNVKTRSERNEIYANWIEGSAVGYHLLDMIGPDGQDPTLAREDSDVVGNVLIQHGPWNVGRLGGDGTGETKGRYRFAFNTIVLGPDAQIFRAQDGIDSLEIDDNVFVADGAKVLLKDDSAAWVTGARTLAGTHNWLGASISEVGDLTGSIVGTDPGFEDAAGFHFVPVKGSPLVDASAAGLAPAGHEIPSPLAVNDFAPPPRSIDNGLMAAARQMVGTPDIGAFEYGSPVNPGTGSGAGNGTGSGAGAGGAGATGGAGGGDAANGASSGCGCRVVASNEASSYAIAAAVGLGIASARRLKRRAR